MKKVIVVVVLAVLSVMGMKALVAKAQIYNAGIIVAGCESGGIHMPPMA